MPTSQNTITGDMLIGEVISLLPESAEIMQDYGLHCTSCSVNAYEPIKMGAMSHGIPEEQVDEMIEKINELGAARKSRVPDDGIYLTERAAEKIKEFAAAEEKEGFGLKITAPANDGREPTYGMDFQKEAAEDEKTVTFHGVNLFFDPGSWKNLLGAEIDFIESAYGNGFKIDNPKFKKKACSCGSGGCGGNGSCGCD